MINRSDKILLAEAQNRFPLVARPYAQIGARLGLNEAAVISRLKRLKKRKLIRYVGAIFDLTRIGCRASLIAMQVPAARVKRVAGLINRYPQITHNYLREGEFNLWFTLNSRSRSQSEALLAAIRRATGGLRMLDLATRVVYKIDARFRLVTDAADRAVRPQPRGQPAIRRKRIALNILPALNQPLSFTPRPFARMAARLGTTEAGAVELLRTYLDDGFIRRFGAVLAHRRVGFTANALAVWQVSPRHLKPVVAGMVANRHISHCYLRRRYPVWPYNLYTMIHARSRRECKAIIALILRGNRNKIKSHTVLFTVKELKKARLDPTWLLRNQRETNAGSTSG